jgi:hypothetical protein
LLAVCHEFDIGYGVRQEGVRAFLLQKNAKKFAASEKKFTFAIQFEKNSF